jgi:hypothetical protein
MCGVERDFPKRPSPAFFITALPRFRPNLPHRSVTILDKPFPPMAPYRRSMREEDPIVRARIGLATLVSQSGAIRLRISGGAPA